MIQTATIPTLADPVLIDAVLLEMQATLAANLPWLDFAFGKAQRLTKEVLGKTIIYPAVYSGKEEYLSVFPDSHIGNFTFFDIENGQDTLSHGGVKKVDLITRLGLIVWFDFRQVYPADWQQRTIDNVKQDVLQVIKANRPAVAKGWRFTSFEERSERIYPGYTNKEISTQFLMRPFGGFRINGEVKYFDQCKL